MPIYRRQFNPESNKHPDVLCCSMNNDNDGNPSLLLGYSQCITIIIIQWQIFPFFSRQTGQTQRLSLELSSKYNDANHLHDLRNDHFFKMEE
jgi:hypothetical protein